MKRLSIPLSYLLFFFIFLPAHETDAHQSGCHRWHSCPSHTDNYICGDTGHCSQCPDNKYCKNGEPLAEKSKKGEKKENREIVYSEKYLCTYVIDGDTIIVDIDGKKEKVRLIGVDAAETSYSNKQLEYFGKESTAFTKKLVEGKKVKLGYDREKRDKYGRILAYVFIEDGTFLNAEIIKQGYGTAYTKFSFKYLDEFKQYEREARLNKRGLWR